jgi:hypothetical protein
MADDKTVRDHRDRSRVAGDQEYEVRYFAEKNGITVKQARELIERCGNDRERLEREVQELKASR